MLPGLKYSADSPLFHYIREYLEDRDVDVMMVDYAYNIDKEFLSDTDDNRLERLKSDGKAVLDFVATLGDFDRITIVGKSVGSISMGWAIPETLPNARLMWLTPSVGGTGLQIQMLRYSYPAYCLIGTRDPGYSQNLVDELSASGITVTVVEGADHGFSHENGAAQSVGMVRQAIEAITEWLDATD